MKDNKAPGNDEITSDIIKQGGEEVTQQLVKLFNQILVLQKIPRAWKEAKIILLFKKGDKADVKNYRPISLLSHLYKIFTKIIQNRIKDILDNNQPREQAGFRAGYSTTDHLQAINQLIEKATEYQLKLCLGFVDYQKAFDSIEHLDMFEALRKVNVDEGYVRILEDIYTDAIARIHIDNDISREVHIQRGVRQGDTLSPKIFTTTIEEVFKKAQLNGGITVDGEMLTDLRFADDVALISTSVSDMNKQITSLNKESKSIGLTMHKDKTKYMTNFDTQEDIEIEGRKLEKVEEYKYLGQTLKMVDTTKEEVLLRIKAGWMNFGRHKHMLTDKNIPMSLRKKLFNQCVLSTMTYGSETWSITKELEQKLTTTQRAMERKMMNLSLRDRVNHKIIRKKTGVTDIMEKVRQSKWRWAGHVARFQDNRWTYRLTEWQPREGKRKRGRQKRRWRVDLHGNGSMD